MATADELLAMASDDSEQIFTADLETRVISIPASVTILGVESDDDVKRLKFNVPRYCGEFDLSEFDIRINFENARGAGDVYPVDDVTVTSDGLIAFSWLVDRHAFLYKGDVTFNICMKKYDDAGVVVKELNTTIATLPVLEGLETDKAVVEKNSSVLDIVLYRLYAVEAAHGIGHDSYYSVITMSESDDGVVFNIVNQAGEIEAIVRHGKDGYTPIKGVDYWTEEDVTEFDTMIDTSSKQYSSQYAKEYADQWTPNLFVVSLSPESWVDNMQTITVEGVTANTLVIAGPEPSVNNHVQYVENGIRCLSQADNSLTFVCEYVPTIAVYANVVLYGVTNNLGE